MQLGFFITVQIMRKLQRFCRPIRALSLVVLYTSIINLTRSLTLMAALLLMARAPTLVPVLLHFAI
jgi:hypothetical protein